MTKLLKDIEALYSMYTDHGYDYVLSKDIETALRNAYTPEERSNLPTIIDEFIEQFDGKLQFIFNAYENDQRPTLLFQPESLLIFERLENNPFRLEDSWVNVLPLKDLEDMSNIWGTYI